MVRPHDAPSSEEVEDALVDGDVAYQRGTAQAALRHRNFRIVYLGTFASNIGTWMQNVVLGAYALEADGLAELRRPHLLRAARPAAVPLDDGRPARRHRRSAAAARHRAVRADGAVVRARGARADRRAAAGRARRARVRDRHRQLARRARPQRDPADARSPRGPAGRGRAAVGADEPLACHRSRDRRRPLRGVRRGAGVRAQRVHVRLRDRRPAVGDVPAPCRRAGRRAGPAAAALGRPRSSGAIR